MIFSHLFNHFAHSKIPEFIVQEWMWINWGEKTKTEQYSHIHDSLQSHQKDSNNFIAYKPQLLHIHKLDLSSIFTGGYLKLWFFHHLCRFCPRTTPSRRVTAVNVTQNIDLACSVESDYVAPKSLEPSSSLFKWRKDFDISIFWLITMYSVYFSRCQTERLHRRRNSAHFIVYRLD